MAYGIEGNQFLLQLSGSNRSYISVMTSLSSDLVLLYLVFHPPQIKGMILFLTHCFTRDMSLPVEHVSHTLVSVTRSVPFSYS